MASNTIKFDDPSGYGFVRPVQDGRTSTTFPFVNNGDFSTCIYSRTLIQTQASYFALKPGTEKDSYWPGGDPDAYNMPDGPIEAVGIGDLVRFTRSYARVPRQQITYTGSRYFPLPAITNDYGNVSALPATDWASAQSIGDGSFSVSNQAVYVPKTNSLYGLAKLSTVRKIGYATAGTFTLTYGANTTASLNWNDSAATIAAAINGLASIISAGLTATCVNGLNSTSGGYLSIGWGLGTTTATQVTMTSSLTKTTTGDCTTFFTGVGTSASGQQILLPDNYTVTSHGFTDTLELVAVRSDNTLAVYSTAYWDDVDANTIWIPTSSSIAGVYFATYSTTYSAGKAILLRTRITEDFFLPGVTAGISTPTSIPIDAGLQNPTEFIEAVVTLTGWQTYETEGPTFWLGGPIYRRAYTAINLDDI